jgi:hypothetical protein
MDCEFHRDPRRAEWFAAGMIGRHTPGPDFAEPVIGPATAGRTRWLIQGYAWRRSSYVPNDGLSEAFQARGPVCIERTAGDERG